MHVCMVLQASDHLEGVGHLDRTQADRRSEIAGQIITLCYEGRTAQRLCARTASGPSCRSCHAPVFSCGDAASSASVCARSRGHLYACADRLASLDHQIRDLTSAALCCNADHHTQYVFTSMPSFVTGQTAIGQICSFHHQGKSSH